MALFRGESSGSTGHSPPIPPHADDILDKEENKTLASATPLKHRYATQTRSKPGYPAIAFMYKS